MLSTRFKRQTVCTQYTSFCYVRTPAALFVLEYLILMCRRVRKCRTRSFQRVQPTYGFMRV